MGAQWRRSKPCLPEGGDHRCALSGSGPVRIGRGRIPTLCRRGDPRRGASGDAGWTSCSDRGNASRCREGSRVLGSRQGRRSGDYGEKPLEQGYSSVVEEPSDRPSGLYASARQTRLRNRRQPRWNSSDDKPSDRRAQAQRTGLRGRAGWLTGFCRAVQRVLRSAGTSWNRYSRKTGCGGRVHRGWRCRGDESLAPYRPSTPSDSIRQRRDGPRWHPGNSRRAATGSRRHRCHRL